MNQFFDGQEEATATIQRREHDRRGQVVMAGTYIRQLLESTTSETQKSMLIPDVGIVQIGRLAVGGDEESYFVKHTHDKTGKQLGREVKDYGQLDTYYFVGPNSISVCEDDLSYETTLLDSEEYADLKDWRDNKTSWFAEHALAGVEEDASKLNILMRAVIKSVVG